MQKQKDIQEKKTAPQEQKINKNLNYLRDKDREKVKGIFRFFEVPGGSMSFNFRAYKGDPVARYDLVDGQQYTIPLGVAKHLNKSGSYPIHEHMLDDSGKAIMKVGKKVKRYAFQSLEFVDIDEFPTATSEIVTVEKV